MPGVTKNEPDGGTRGDRDDLSTMDEVKVFKEEGDEENEENATESLHADLFEEKSSLINESEQFLSKRPLPAGFPNPYSVGYFGNPYAAAYGIPRGPFPPFSADHLFSPPPAHMGSLPYERPSLPPASIPAPPYQHALPPQLSHYGTLGLEQLAAWQASVYQQRPNYPLPLPSSGFPRFPGSDGLPPHLLPSPHHLLQPQHIPLVKPEIGHPHGLSHQDMKGENPGKAGPHIKKPLNAFMLYMKEMRPIVQAECTLKESAAINQILGRRWHGLPREEQAVYYEKAREERQKHQVLYPNWNARDNYNRTKDKPKKRKVDKNDPAANIKKCRARYGIEQPALWCKPCRRKKKCIRVQMYLEGHSEQEIDETCADASGKGFVGDSVGEAASPGSDGGSAHSQEGSADQSVPSPAFSIPSLDSPYNFPGSPTPGPSQQLRKPCEPFRQPSQSYKPGPVGSDPRDSSNPLSISFLTGSQWEGHWNKNDINA